MPTYTITCDCTGHAVPIATIRDRRAEISRIAELGTPVADAIARRYTHTALTVDGIGPDTTAHQVAVADGDRHSKLYVAAAKTCDEYAVTTTTWGDGHESWTIRCPACHTKAQLHHRPSDSQVVRVMDALAAAPQALPKPDTVPLHLLVHAPRR